MFLDLSDTEQRRVKNTTIHAIIFAQQQASPDDTSLFQVFERINTSGRTLLPQEIRNCVAQGNFNELLFELNRYPTWRMLFGLPEPDARMRDMEAILRFFALTSKTYKADQREKISLRRFLDLFMKSNATLSSHELRLLSDRFTSAIDLIATKFGPFAFHNASTTDTKKFVPKFSPTIYDSTLIAADYVLCNRSYVIRADPDEARRSLLRDDEYRVAISKETMTKENINKRISKACSHLFGVKYE
jgi:hypothetical protein